MHVVNHRADGAVDALEIRRRKRLFLQLADRVFGAGGVVIAHALLDVVNAGAIVIIVFSKLSIPP